MKREFIKRFPFDIINLDLERYLFRPNEKIPGNVIRAFRKIFEWQCLPGQRPDGSNYHVDEFTLMFTTRLGPANLEGDYLEMLRKYVEDNLARDAMLAVPYSEQSKDRNPADFLNSDFENFFKLAVPKTIVSLLWEQDWEIDAKSGVRVFEFERETEGDPYRMLHFVMAVRRISPNRDARPPGQIPEAASKNYGEVVRNIFSTKPEDVAVLLRDVGEAEIQSHLDEVKAHRITISNR